MARDPDIAAAIPELVRAGELSPELGARLVRPAAGLLLSVRRELRAALYLGVLAVTGGVSLLVKENLDHIGPAGVAVLIAAAAAAALGWVVRRAPPFSWQESPSPHLAFDYVLLLGMLLVAADLAYVEVHFTALGAAWPWHLLIVAVLYGAAALRFDSRSLFALALAAFAAWRGVAVGVGTAASALLDRHAESVRWNALSCGVLFILLAAGLRRFGRKPHFAPVADWLGWLLGLGALLSGALRGAYEGALWWAAASLAAGIGLAVGAFRVRRFGLFALGVVAAYIAVTRLLAELVDEPILGCFWLFGSSLALLGGLIVAQRRMREAP